MCLGGRGEVSGPRLTRAMAPRRAVQRPAPHSRSSHGSDLTSKSADTTPVLMADMLKELMPRQLEGTSCSPVDNWARGDRKSDVRHGDWVWKTGNRRVRESTTEWLQGCVKNVKSYVKLLLFFLSLFYRFSTVCCGTIITDFFFHLPFTS